ncbi:hypothetical protein EJ913_20380 [Azospirillum doebereinerae]|uniref:Uncharacterized protein n=1 Tax=Azospirillum doebereinerae TaxID=92933 RepID=A0A3S0WT95_9PROT|nr:hypothetical protein EJ913_20380 [Azospirillum doebereinerae]
MAQSFGIDLVTKAKGIVQTSYYSRVSAPHTPMSMSISSSSWGARPNSRSAASSVSASTSSLRSSSGRRSACINWVARWISMARTQSSSGNSRATVS